jgi:hypothetical protein
MSFLVLMGLVPLLLANRSCERSTTWGDEYFSEWESDHVEIDKDSKCVDCHDDVTSKKVKPSNHDATWIREHGGFEAKKYSYKNENVCSLCHAESQCTSCHQQQAPAQHTEFWKQRGHGIFTGLDRSKCMTCHKDVQFCESCHSVTAPVKHTAGFGAPSNRHCNDCHYPLGSAGAQECAVCHESTPSHALTPAQPNNPLHVTGADCRLCHSPVRHPDNGMSCTTCHQ